MAATARSRYFQSGEGPAAGRRVVLIAGDEEYRSEEALPKLANDDLDARTFDALADSLA